jgi:DNA-directed RNA polymerase subunit RPC12/RpoP
VAREIVRGKEFIRFPCGGCRQRLKARPRSAGRHVACPHCATRQLVPVPGEVIPEVLPVRRRGRAASDEDDLSVPLEIALPHNLGRVKAVTSRRDSSNMLYGLIGGGLALAGVALCAILGIRRTNA